MLEIDVPEPIDADGNPHFQALIAYLRNNVDGFDGSVTFSRFTGGYSNLSYLIASPTREIVLKAPPPGIKAKAAHDVGREFNFVSRLYGTYPYLPRPILYCDNPAIFGASFCIMERLRGIVVRTYPEDGSVTTGLPHRHFSKLIEALAELHSLDYEKLGLGCFGRPVGYRRRQLDGWRKRLEVAGTPDMVDFSVVLSWLYSHLPSAAERAAVVHNDFKLDNLMWSPAELTRLLGVLDWEMATIGDPLMDLACTLSFWIDKGDPAEFQALRGMPSAKAGVFSRREAMERYVSLGGREMAGMNFFLCFAYLRRAAIEQQKFFRFARGESLDQRYAHLGDAVRVLRDMCLGVMDGRVTT